MDIFGWLKKRIDKPLGGRAHIKWNEPRLYILRLQNQAGIVLGFFAAYIVVASLIMIAVVSMNDNPPELWVPLVIGLIIGVMVGLVFFNRMNRMDGDVSVREHAISRRKMHSSGFTMTMQDEKWPYESIENCQIIPGEDIGKRFSVLVIYHYRGIDVIGVSGRAKVDKIANFLIGKGVAVSRGSKVPKSALPERVSLSMPTVALAAMVVVAFIAMGYAGNDINFNNNNNNVQKQQADAAADERKKFVEKSRKAMTDFHDQKQRDFNDAVSKSPSAGFPGTGSSSSPGSRPSPGPGAGPPGFSTHPGLPRTVPHGRPHRPPFGPPRTSFGPGRRSSHFPPGPNSGFPSQRPTKQPKPKSFGYRQWTDSSGEFKIEAKMTKFTDEKVTLQKRDGQKVTVPLERLSEADQKFVADRAK